MAQKTVVLGVSACIGAYKACYVVRGLQKAGVRVRVVMTKHATELVGVKTFEALTHEPVLVDMFDSSLDDPIPHISLAKEADLMIVAPCTANLLAKLAHGVADDLLSSAVLAMHCPVLVAPAANTHMYEDASTQENLSTVRNRGWTVVEGGDGYLACGDEGYGRLAEPESIVEQALALLQVKPDLAGLKVLVTAGPTREAIDPVRFISNYSSGKTGFALAEAAQNRGAEVALVTGPTNLPTPDGVKVVRVESALEMFQACQDVFDDVDLAIFSSAVCDYRPASRSSAKLKKGRDGSVLGKIELVENPDILATLAADKTSQVVVGYAAETEDVVQHAQEKLATKNADFIVANEVGPGKGFATDENKVWLVDGEGAEEVELLSKSRIADIVLDKALAIHAAR